MTQAIIIANWDANNQEAIRDLVKEINGVHEAHLTSGIYDLILKTMQKARKS